MKSIPFLGLLAATAGTALAWSGPGSGLIVLHPTQSSALSMTGNSSVYVPTRAVYVNSNSTQAVRTSGGATLDTPQLFVVGGTSFSSQSMVTGTVYTGSTPAEDPLWNYSFPSPGGVPDHGGRNLSGGTHVLLPGYYSGGISISGNANVTLTPGIYQIAGSGLSMTSGQIAGDGVTIVMHAGSLSMAGGTGVLLSPPASGVTIAQAQWNTSLISLSGGSGVIVTGAIYCPGAKLDLVGTSQNANEAPQWGDLIVARTVELKGNGIIRIGDENQQAIAPQRQPLYD